MDNPKTKAIRGTRHRTMTNETKKNKEKKNIWSSIVAVMTTPNELVV